MGKILKTYAVYGMMEWVCQIVTGKCKLTVPFSGGAQTGYGVTPALYSTDKPVVQAIIENSVHFKSGKIKLYRSVGSEVDSIGNGNDDVVVIAKSRNCVIGGEADGANEPNGANEANTTSGGCGMPVREFPDYDSAKDWLVDELGVERKTLKGPKSVMEAAAAKGYELRVN